LSLIKKWVVFFIKKYKYRNSKLDALVHTSVFASLSNVVAKNNSRFAADSDVRDSVIAEYSSIGRNTKITHTNMGKFCAISWDCTINAISHPIKNLSIHAFPYVPHAGDFVKERVQKISVVEIGNDVWVGANSVITSGIKIGNGAVVAAGAVVVKDVPSYAVVAGVPAKIIKYRFSKDMILKLENLEWWNWDREWIKENVALFQRELSIEMIDELENVCNKK